MDIFDPNSYYHNDIEGVRLITLSTWNIWRSFMNKTLSFFPKKTNKRFMCNCVPKMTPMSSSIQRWSPWPKKEVKYWLWFVPKKKYWLWFQINVDLKSLSNLPKYRKSLHSHRRHSKLKVQNLKSLLKCTLESLSNLT